MSSGNNIPPPPKGGPIPPPPKGGPGGPGGPPPAMKPVKKLADMTKDERIAWIDAGSGLNLKVLKAGRYPNEVDILKRIGAKESDAGKGIPDSDAEMQKKLAAELQAILKAKLIELFTLAETDPTKAAPLIKKIEDTMKRWKGSAAGLNDFYDLLQKELPSSTATAKAKSSSRPLPSPDLNDKEYQKLLTLEEKAKQESAALTQEYEKLYKQYQTAGAEKKSALYEQLVAVVQKINEQRGNISNFKGRVRESEEKVKQIEMQIAAPERAKQIAINKLRDEIAALKNEQGYTDPDTKAENQKQIAKLEKDIQLEEVKPSHTQEALAVYQEALTKAEQVVANNQAKAEKANSIIALFSVPTTWAKVNSEERKRAEAGNQKPKLTGDFDPKGMIIGDKGQRQIDLRSLDANQLSRLARFFSHTRNEFSISDNDSIIALTKEINGALAVSPLVTFDVLMDIAEGKLKRKENTFAPYIAQQYFIEDDLVRDNSRKPNYDKLLQRNESLRDVELNKKRGITFSGKDYLNRKRTIELNYFTDTQMQKLQQFFATAKGDLQTPEGGVNREAVTARINQLLNQTNLTFEDITDIAEGHLVRKSAHAPSDHFTVLLKDVERKGNAPNYDALVQQRTDYIAEQARLKREAQELERKQAQEEKAQAIAKMQGEAIAFIHAQQEQFEKPFKKRIPDFTLDVDDITEFQIFADVVQVEANKQEGMTSALQDAILQELRQMNPAVTLTSELPSPKKAETTVPTTPQESKPASKPELVQSKPTSETRSLKHDETALQIVKNILSDINIKSRFKKADVDKKFGFASYKVFQNKKRGGQLKMLDDAIKEARNLILKDPDAAFTKIDNAIIKVQAELEKELQQGKRKLGESRLEKAVNDLNKEVDKMKSVLGVTPKKEPQSPKLGN